MAIKCIHLSLEDDWETSNRLPPCLSQTNNTSIQWQCYEGEPMITTWLSYAFIMLGLFHFLNVPSSLYYNQVAEWGDVCNDSKFICDVADDRCTLAFVFGKINNHFLIESSWDALTVKGDIEEEKMKQIFITRK